MNISVKSLSLSRDDILAQYAPKHQEDGDITLRMAMETWRIGATKARKMLNQIPNLTVIEGVMLNNGKLGRVWRPVKRKAAKG